MSRRASRSRLLAFIAALTVIFFGLVFGAHGAAAQSAPGTVITNTVSMTVDGAPVTSASASFTVAPVEDVQASIEFFTRDARNGSPVTVRPSFYINASGASVPLAAPRSGSDQGQREVINLSKPAPLRATNGFLPGQDVFFIFRHAGMNIRSDAIDEAVITLRNRTTGDEETLVVFETGPDTGVFAGYIRASSSPTPPADGVLTAPSRSQLSVIWQDPARQAGSLVDFALIGPVDPFGVVFSATDGSPINGARVTILDAATGLPARVLGRDLSASYPSSVVTGESVTDSNGNFYDLEPGEFRFPFVDVGDYRLMVEPPRGFAFPSTATDAALQDLSGAPWALVPGSRGEVFEVSAGPAIQVDVPLDATDAIVVSKTSPLDTAEIGDIVPFEITLTFVAPSDAAPIGARFIDTMPVGLDYVGGSLRIDGVSAGPDLSSNGREIAVAPVKLEPGVKRRITYLVRVAVNAPIGRDLVNAARAEHPRALSNVAEHALRIDAAFGADHIDIVGRIKLFDANQPERFCKAEDEISPEHAPDLSGVRVYLEDGRFASTDSDGLYHFSRVSPGVHVTQIDTASLLEGATAILCNDNTRTAGSATSRFVDAKAGGLWRSDFAITLPMAPRALDGDLPVRALDRARQNSLNTLPDDLKGRRAFDQNWIDRRFNGEASIVWPSESGLLDRPSADIIVAHTSGDKVRVLVDGAEPAGVNRAQGLVSRNGAWLTTAYSGVPVTRSETLIVAEITGPDGQVRRLERRAYYVSDVSRARVDIAASRLASGGGKGPEIAIRVTDDQGRVAHPGMIIAVSVASPYEIDTPSSLQDRRTARLSGSASTSLEVGPDGVLRIPLTRTAPAGDARVQLDLARGPVDVRARIGSEAREWIVVGLAEGTVGHRSLSGSMESLDAAEGIDASPIYTEGRVALFAKGVIKGDWLVTLRYDSARGWDEKSDRLLSGIDRDAYYAVYGDESIRGDDAQSAYPLYLRLEKDAFTALFGDFDTGLSSQSLIGYDRRLSGLKLDHAGESVSAFAFAAEADQGFRRDIIAADGTTGPYALSATQPVRYSERITLEIRDRDRPWMTMASAPQVRGRDYDIDFDRGVVFFNTPLRATDEGLNPRVIVIEYETKGAQSGAIIAGGRVEAAISETVSINAATVHEGDNGQGVASTTITAGATIALDDNTRVEVEAGASRSSDLGGMQTHGASWRGEVIHSRDGLEASAYVRRESTGFSPGASTADPRVIERMGASLEARLMEGERTLFSEEAVPFTVLGFGEGFMERDLSNGDRAFVLEGGFRYKEERRTTEGALRFTDARIGDASGSAVSARTQSSYTSPTGAVTYGAGQESVLLSFGDLAPTDRSMIFIDWRATDWLTLSASHEAATKDFLDGVTFIGAEIAPWTGGRLSLGSSTWTGADEAATARAGFDQLIDLGGGFSASAGVAHQARLLGGDIASSSSETASRGLTVSGLGSAIDAYGLGATRDLETYSVANAAVSYVEEDFSASIRAERRMGEEEDRTRLNAIVVGDIGEAISLSGEFSVLATAPNQGSDTLEVDLSLGGAYRPLRDGPIFLNRLDIGRNEDAGFTYDKIANTFSVNVQPTEASELTLRQGLKYVSTKSSGMGSSDVVALFGAEARHDIGRDFDIGVHGGVLHSLQGGDTRYSIGASVGWSPFEDAWISVGYNAVGFDDKDFQDAGYTAQGPFVQLRLKFDQDSLRGVLRRISN